MTKAKTVDDWNDRVYLLFPKGSKSRLREYLQERFGNDNINHYVKTLIELDLMGKVEWGVDVGNHPLLREMAAVKEK